MNKVRKKRAWDPSACGDLIAELLALRESMLAHEGRLRHWLDGVDETHRASATNLVHYLAMRRVDLRRLQERLSWIGVSSLGRSETHVLANLDKVLGILHVLAGRPWTPRTGDEPAGFQSGRALLDRNAEALFGGEPPGRPVRIMVTLPSEASWDSRLVESMVEGGMDIARVNCAHDDAPRWLEMIANVRGAAARVGRHVRILMDLGGPKLRTGPIEPGPCVLRVRPLRDDFGVVSAPARVGLREKGSDAVVAGATAHVGVDRDWLAKLEAGDHVEFVDARGAERTLLVAARTDAGALVECDHTAYYVPATRLVLRRGGRRGRQTALHDIPALPGRLLLHRGDVVRLVCGGVGHPARAGARGRPARPATVACTLPQALAALRKGERVWFDDGRIGGVVRRRTRWGVEVEVTVAREGGERLAADKGINLPDTALDLPALSADDVADLAIAAKHADIVGLSFAQSAADVVELRTRLRELGASRVGILLKIETQRGFERLPEMLFAAMGARAAGVMIARGDLAVECGYERMAEVQEEILWACEAAHLPVVWATQVLETLAKSGLPSRAEITDAAMGERAECVMLNKGPHILDAIRTLDDIMRRMQQHQNKKRTLLRALKSWQRSLEREPPAAGATPGATPGATSGPRPR